MAKKDALTVLSSAQDISATTLSQRAIDLKGLADYGVQEGYPWYVLVTCRGQISKDLRVQIIGSETETFDEVYVVGDSGVYPTADLVEGYEIPVQMVQTDKKYRYICLRYIPSAAGTTNDASATPTDGVAFEDTANFDPPTLVGADRDAIADAVDAMIVLGVATKVNYPYANLSKITAGNVQV